MSTAAPTLPLIGTAWPGQGGIFAGIVLGEVDGQTVNMALILAEARPSKRLDWDAAMAWAKTVEADGHADFELPDRKEQRVLWANVQARFEADWYWSGTQYSRDLAWSQYFDDGFQDYYVKSYEGLAVAVRRFSIQSLSHSEVAA
jgi:hypothetical protein